MKLNKFDVLLGLWISLVNALLLSLVMPLIAGIPLTFGGYLSSLMFPFILGFLLTTLIPIPKWGNAMAGKFGLKPFSLKRQLVASVFIVLVMGTIMTLVLTYLRLHNGPQPAPDFFATWIRSYPISLLVIYVAANIALSTGFPLVKKILGFKNN